MTADVTERTIQRTDTTYETKKCGDRFDQQSDETVDRLGLKDMMCIDEGMKLKGNYYTEDYQRLSLNVRSCVNGTVDGVVCKDPNFIE